MQINMTKAKSILPQRGALPALAAMVVCGALASPAWGATLTLESCLNQSVFNIEGTPGTAGVQGTDYVLGSYLERFSSGLSRKGIPFWADL